MVPGDAPVRARRAITAGRTRGRGPGTRLAGGGGARRRARDPGPGDRGRPDPGRRRTAHVAGAAARTLVRGVEGGGPAARDRPRAATRRLLPADRAGVTGPAADRQGRRVRWWHVVLPLVLLACLGGAVVA